MKKRWGVWLVTACMLVAMFLGLSLKAEAGNERSGTLGDNNGIQWTYDEDTKTLTITGEDSGLHGGSPNYQSPFYEICSNVEKIVVKDCTLHGDVSYLFRGLSNVQSIVFYNFDTSNVTSMLAMFGECSNLTELDLSSFDTSQVIDMSNMFWDCSSLSELDISNFDTLKVTNMDGMFYGCLSLTELNLSNFNTSKVTDMSYMFVECSNLTELDLSSFDTSKVTSMSNMFYCCNKLSDLDVSGFNTSKVTNMNSMFYRCYSLKKLDIGVFDTSQCTVMRWMFYDCNSLTELDVSGFDTSQVMRMEAMFSNCSNLAELDVSNFDTSKVTSMGNMFYCCNKLSDLDVSGFNTSKVTDMTGMFHACSSLSELDVSSFDTSKVTAMDGLFSGCSGLIELDLSNFDTSQVRYMDDMFENCSSLEELDLSNFDMNHVEFTSSMLSSCSSLTLINVPKIISEKISITLPGIYSDSKGNETIYITSDYCSELLRRIAVVPVTGITLTKDKVSMLPNKIYYLQANVGPANATNKAVTWKSSNTAVATVDSNGKVTAVAPGTATITATAKDGSGKSASCSVTVTQPVTGITLNKTSISLQKGGTYTLIATVSPSYASNKTVTWMSSNDSVATVDANGKVTAVATGTATISVIANDLSGNGADCEVIVIQPVTDIVLSNSSVNLKTGGTYTLTATVSPSNATNKTLTWKSSNTAVATVDSNGKVTAVGAGSATITATAKDGSGKSASCSVTVTEPMSEKEKQVRAFVERMYTIVLGRAAEEQGLSDWSKRLMNKEIDGATLVDMFVNSDEFIARNTSDEDYIKILYRAVLGREADADGLKMWKDMLADGWTRDYIMEGLVLSTEFKSICDSYGIIAAFEPTAESQVRSFVKRMYTVVLSRRADAVGLNEWTQRLMNGTANGAQLADGFISSSEFVNRNLSNEKYIKVLYRAFFNREADEGGFNVWMSELAKGVSRRDVMKGFVHSVEFSDLCAQYGIIRGEIQ